MVPPGGDQHLRPVQNEVWGLIKDQRGWVGSGGLAGPPLRLSKMRRLLALGTSLHCGED